MRSIPSDIASRLSLKAQTRANSADPSARITIGRPTTALTVDTFLERQTVVEGTITDTSIAVCHPRAGTDNTTVYIAYIQNGVAKVTAAATRTRMSNHIWVDSGFSEDASAISIAFDGIMPKNNYGAVEFITERKPWVFWIDGGALYAKKLDSETTVTLAEQNCTDVSAIRAMWSEVGGFDFGLVVFFILSGTLYYRQLIDGEWTDAEVVSLGPDGVSWASIAAFRTWDYRVGVQAKATGAGGVYELFTQFMGIGKQNVEHISVNDVDADSDFIKINYSNTSETEHVDVDSISAESLKQWGQPVYGVSAENVEDSNSDWGHIVEITLDHPCNMTSVENNNLTFSMSDEHSASYNSTSVSVSSDGMKLVVGFLDFNAAYGNLTMSYTPGTIKSPPINPDILMETWSIEFTPTNLIPPIVNIPTVIGVSNI